MHIIILTNYLFLVKPYQAICASWKIVIQHQKTIIGGSNEEDFKRKSIRRSHLFRDALHAFSLPSFNVSNMLKVVFIGEQSVDDGGPRREFLQLLQKGAFTRYELFSGWPLNVAPIHNVVAVAANSYYMSSEKISLIKGGQPPVCFSVFVAENMVCDEVKSKPNLDDIPQYTVRQTLVKVGCMAML